MENKTVKEYVEEVLKADYETRNKYNRLVIQVLRQMGLKIGVNESLLDEMPSIETITRVCREIQNEENRLIPNKETREKRTKAEKEYKEHYKQEKLNYTTMKNSWMSV
jgi:hypothetical protein